MTFGPGLSLKSSRKILVTSSASFAYQDASDYRTARVSDSSVPRCLAMNPKETSRPIRFGPYEADFHTQELRKHGTKLKLTGQPLQILEILVSRPGQLVSRSDLQQQLWPGQVLVDSSHGLNAAVNKLREALSDSASQPKYIETLPRRGYRFIGKLEGNLDPFVLAPEASSPAEAVPSDRMAGIETAILQMPILETSEHTALPWTIASTAVVFLFVIGLLLFGSKHFNSPENAQRLRKFANEKLAAAGGMQAISTPNAADGGISIPTDKNYKSAPRLRRLIWGDGGNAAPQFSPDGHRLAFMSDRNGSWQIWMSDADGARPRQISFTESAGTPRWSPDGSSIAFDAPFNGNTWIFVVHVDRNEADRSQADQSEHARPIVEGRVPSFSRDGKWIYFASERTGEWQVWKTSVRDGTEAQVTFHGGFAALESTDGYIYYSKSRYPQPEVCRVRIQGGEESCGFQHLRPRTWASWAPTRQGIVFAEDLPDGQAELSLYDPTRRQVRDLVMLQSAPFWVGASVDGKRALMNDAAEQQISMVENLR
jgi:Tol biopolymer transport system component/DNA-binding winged helix-turn-helix (wHTH) protein